MPYAVIPAAGRGARFGGETPKQFLALRGLPMIVRSLAPFQASPLIDEIVCAVSKNEITSFERLVQEYRITKVKRIVPGGERRQDSVQAAVAFLEKEKSPDDIVLVHDGVRPLASAALIERIVEAARKFGAAIPALPLTDSLKRLSPSGVIEQSVSREHLWTAQTPQGFRLSILVEALRRAEKERFWGTDEAALVERLGAPVHCVEGTRENIKITSPEDFEMAELLIMERERRSS